MLMRIICYAPHITHRCWSGMCGLSICNARHAAHTHILTIIIINIIIGGCACGVCTRSAVRPAHRKFEFNGQQYTKHAARRKNTILQAVPWNIGEITSLLCAAERQPAS